MSEDEMTKAEGYGTYGKEPIAVFEVTPPLEPSKGVIHTLLRVAPPILAKDQWAISVMPDGWLLKPEGMTEAQAILLTHLFSLPHCSLPEITPWVRETCEKWAPWLLEEPQTE